MGSRKDGAGKRVDGMRGKRPRDAQSWTEIVTEGRRRFMTEWRKGEEEKSKTRREKRTTKERENPLRT